MFQILVAAAMAPGDVSAHLRADLEHAVQGIPIHGHHFRAVVGHIAAKYSDDFGHTMHELSFQHPVGLTDSTLVRVGGSRYFTFSFIVFRRRHRIRVESLNIKNDFDESAVNAIAGLAAWSGDRLCTFVHYPGGTGNSDGARLFEVDRSGLGLVKQIEGYGENAWDGSLTRDSIVSTQPADIRESLTVRCPAPGLEDRGSHSAIWLDYRQVWRFSNGQLRQIQFWRLPTPAAALYHLFHLVEHHRRRAFNLLVPKPLQNRLWNELLRVDHDAYRTDGENDGRDDCPNLAVGGVLPVTLTKVHGSWTVTRVGKRRPAPEFG